MLRKKKGGDIADIEGILKCREEKEKSRRGKGKKGAVTWERTFQVVES